MNLRLSFVVGLLAVTVVGGCECGPGTRKINPVLSVGPTQLDFGKVKVGDAAARTVRLSAQVNAPVSLTSVTLRDGNAPGGAAAFQLVEPPTSVPALSDSEFTIHFRPDALQAYEAELVIASNDEEHPEILIPITGEGAHPLMSVTPDCQATRHCRGTVTVDPPAIDFGEEPLQRAVPLPATELPTITVVNEGEVPLAVSRIAIEGADATAFKVDGNAQLPGGGAPALVFQAGEGVNLPIRFTPTSEQKLAYSAQVVIEGDDPQKPKVTVALTGALDPDPPPVVCANIIAVTPEGGTPVRYDTKAEWDLLLARPAEGYDFTQTRDIAPQSDVQFSAISDATNEGTCTTDPEDGRTGLSYQWAVTRRPPGAVSVALTNATSATPTLSAQSLKATGEYEVSLTVTDATGHATSTTLKFAVVLKQDLVIQLSWNGDEGSYANVDLDLHLVRPSSTTTLDPFRGAFSYFEEGPNQQTSGDMNGYASRAWVAKGGQGADFDWGEPGELDDPRLNLDDVGTSGLVENISLNHPENDPRCAAGDCVYKVFVHYFVDKRDDTTATACSVSGTTGCLDGDVCSCTVGRRCVASNAPKGTSATGSGKCYLAPKPVVRIFVRSNPTPAAVIPLDTLVPADDLAIGAPCHMLYVADIVWPKRGSTVDAGIGTDGGTEPQPQVIVKGADATGRIKQPQIRRFGIRAASGLQCIQNMTIGPDNWYAEEPL